MITSTILKALTFRASSIGDCLMGKYLLENIHEQFPNARCGLLVASRGEMIRGLFAAYSWLEVIEANRRNLSAILSTYIRFRDTDFTVTQYSENKFSTTSKIFARLITKKGGLAGFNDGWLWNRFIYDCLLPFEGEQTAKAMFLYEQDSLRTMGMNVPIKELELAFNKNERVLDNFKLNASGYFIVHLFSGNDGRGLRQSRRLELIHFLRSQFGDKFPIVLTGAKDDLLFVDEIAKKVPVISAAGKTAIQELINLVYFSKGVVSIDTGVAHIAAHLQKPLVTLTRCESRYSWWSPRQYSKNLVVLCNEAACGRKHIDGTPHACLNEISFSLVCESLRSLVKL